MVYKMNKNPVPVYDEKTIKTLSSLEHIRMRPGMYIGRIGDGSNPDDGIYILLKEVIDNSIDEFIMGFGKKIKITIEENFVTVRDFGRGIPLGKVIECVSVINTGAKYNDDVFQFSVGLNGVGTKAVNCLSSHFRVVSFREGEYFEAFFAKGKLMSKRKGSSPNEPNGTLIEFHPDKEILCDSIFTIKYVEQRLWNYAYLNIGLKLIFGDRTFESKNGLLDLLHNKVGDETIYPIAHFKSKSLEFAFTHTHDYGETYFSFVNGQCTGDGGTHLSSFREGILKGINEFYKKDYSGLDVRESFSGAVSVKLRSPVFESQTKNKLSNTEIRGLVISDVKYAVIDFLHKNSESAKKLNEKIAQNERLRKELNSVKNEAKDAAKRIEIRIPNLKDCKYHYCDNKNGEETMLFLTEGLSAGGSIISSRNVYTQAVFTLKGKPENVFGSNRSAIYKNEELYSMMMVLGIENNLDTLRYNKIIIATDADVDGFHIRNLLMTFFLSYFEELVVGGHVFILETPLFRVRNRHETRYCYSEKEKNITCKEIKDSEITRFKGLGEISPKEFGQFIGDDMRLVKLDVKSIRAVPETLEFYMGKNTPLRREFIMENLV
jgi:topoisomerase-4 subunit B